MVVLAAVDRSNRAKEVIKEAETLANAYGDKLHAVHVLSQAEFVELEQTEANRRNTAMSMDRVREFATHVAKEAASDVDASVECVGLVGDPAEHIIEYAQNHDAKYIVVIAGKRSPTGKAIFGSVAQQLLLNAPCPVVVSIDQTRK